MRMSATEYLKPLNAFSAFCARNSGGPRPKVPYKLCSKNQPPRSISAAHHSPHDSTLSLRACHSRT
jgi:hypothetical protein